MATANGRIVINEAITVEVLSIKRDRRKFWKNRVTLKVVSGNDSPSLFHLHLGDTVKTNVTLDILE